MEGTWLSYIKQPLAYAEPDSVQNLTNPEAWRRLTPRFQTHSVGFSRAPDSIVRFPNYEYSHHQIPCK